MLPQKLSQRRVLPGTLVAYPGDVPEQAAERLRGLRGVELELAWSYSRSPSTWQRLRIRRTRRGLRPASERVSRRYPITIDCAHVREHVLGHWRHRDEWQNLAAIADPADYGSPDPLAQLSGRRAGGYRCWRAWVTDGTRANQPWPGHRLGVPMCAGRSATSVSYEG